MRVIPNVPPIVDKTPTQGPPREVSAGRYEFQITKRPQTSLTTGTLLDKLESSRKNFFEIVLGPLATPRITAESVKKVDGSFAKGAAVPVGFNKSKLRGRRFPRNEEEKVEYHLMNLNSGFFPGYFRLPREGQLSPVLVTYAYDTFGPAPGSALHYPLPK